MEMERKDKREVRRKTRNSCQITNFEMQWVYIFGHNLKTTCTFFSAFLLLTFGWHWPSCCPCSLSQLLTKYRGTSPFMFNLQTVCTPTRYVLALQTPFRKPNSDCIQQLKTDQFKLSHSSVTEEWIILFQPRTICVMICMFTLFCPVIS